jgi:hypothetical protein
MLTWLYNVKEGMKDGIITSMEDWPIPAPRAEGGESAYDCRPKDYAVCQHYNGDKGGYPD